VDQITQIEEVKDNRNLKAENLLKEINLLNIARLAKMLVDLFGSDVPFEKIGRRDGQEIELYVKDLNGSITFPLTKERNNFDCYMGKPTAPISKITITVQAEKLPKIISKIIRSKSNLFGIIKLIKYIIPGKIKIKGSYISTIKWARCLMIGNHSIYENKD
jgi:hypothetical protein